MLIQNGDLRGSSVPSLLTKANPQALIGPEQGGPRAKTRAGGPSPPRAHRMGQGSGLLRHPAHHVQACGRGPCAPPASSQGTNPACGRREHQARAHARGKDAVPPALAPRATEEPPRSSCHCSQPHRQVDNRHTQRRALGQPSKPCHVLP